MAGLPKILLVEDNPQIVDIYTAVLEKHGYPLVKATTVDEALEKAKETSPDIILLDIMLPGGSTGMDALRILRNDPAYGCTDKRIVLLTNLGMTEKLQKIWEEYADGYVVKVEIVPEELIDVIKSFEK